MSPSTSTLTARPASRVRHRDHPLPEHDHLLREHLRHDHGRTDREIDGLPLADLHHFEHVEQAMGLNDVSHRHPAGPGRVR